MADEIIKKQICTKGENDVHATVRKINGACVGVDEGEGDREGWRKRERIFVVTRADRCASNKDFIHAVL